MEPRHAAGSRAHQAHPVSRPTGRALPAQDHLRGGGALDTPTAALLAGLLAAPAGAARPVTPPAANTFTGHPGGGGSPSDASQTPSQAPVSLPFRGAPGTPGGDAAAASDAHHGGEAVLLSAPSFNIPPADPTQHRPSAMPPSTLSASATGAGIGARSGGAFSAVKPQQQQQQRQKALRSSEDACGPAATAAMPAPTNSSGEFPSPPLPSSMCCMLFRFLSRPTSTRGAWCELCARGNDEAFGNFICLRLSAPGARGGYDSASLKCVLRSSAAAPEAAAVPLPTASARDPCAVPLDTEHNTASPVPGSDSHITQS